MPTPDQQSLLPRREKIPPNSDYVGIFPDRVFPTGGCDILERDGNLLIIKQYARDRQITGAQRRIWNTLVRYGTIDAPGSITVFCVWKTSQSTREIVIFDRAETIPARRVTQSSYKQLLFDWWNAATLK